MDDISICRLGGNEKEEKVTEAGFDDESNSKIRVGIKILQNCDIKKKREAIFFHRYLPVFEKWYPEDRTEKFESNFLWEFE